MNSGHCQADAALIQRCLEADDQAWTILLKRYGSLIYTIACRWDLAPEDVADVFQSVCLTVIERLRMFNHKLNFSAWLTSVTLKHCQRVRQRHARRAAASDPAAGGKNDAPVEPADFRETIQRLEEERLIQQAISMLAPLCQRLLVNLLYERDPKVTQELRTKRSPAAPARRRCLKELLEVLDGLGF